MTHLRKMMLDELQRRNYAQNTVRTYIRIVERFAKHFGRSPAQLGPEQIREYQVHLFRDQHLSSGTVEQHVAALRFFYVKLLRRKLLKLIDAAGRRSLDALDTQPGFGAKIRPAMKIVVQGLLRGVQITPSVSLHRAFIQMRLSVA